MSTLKNIITAMRNDTSETDDLLSSNNGMRAFEQEIADAKSALNHVKQDLTDVIAKEAEAGQKIDTADLSIKDIEIKIAHELSIGNSDKANLLTEKAAELEKEKEDQEKFKTTFSEQVNLLKQDLESAEKVLSEYERQLSMIRTTQNVQKATATITDDYNTMNNSMLSAKESLSRIREQHEHIKSDSHPNNLTAENENRNAVSAILARVKKQNT